MIAFTGGIGENAPKIRKMVIDDMKFLGAQLDDVKNNMYEQEMIIWEMMQT